jgi:endo-1,3-1,4-beta-glycanase ExoK
MIRRCMTLVLACLSTMIPVTALAMASAELYTTKSYTYGRFEARIQHAPGDGVVSAYFLWKDGSELSGAYWNEIDFEKIGADCSMQTNARYGTSVANHSQMDKMPGNSCAEYHDYRIEWTPSYIAWAVDGNEFRRDTGDAAKAFSENASAGMQIRFNIWPGNASFGGDISNTTLPVHQYISWAQYSSYTDGNFEVQWREEFQNSGVPAGWAVGNWDSPYNLSTHSPDNVGFVDGIAVLSLTADDGTGQPGTPPPDDGTSATSGTGGTAGGGGSTATGKGDSGGCSMASQSRSAGTTLLEFLVLVGWLCMPRRGRRSRYSSSDSGQRPD